jgi:DNA-directed RNA polymerase subunit N
MLIPVRCFTCGKVVGSFYEEYQKRIERGENPKNALDALGLKRYCCRKMLISHSPLVEDVIPF